jgi:alkaline phosphatase
MAISPISYEYVGGQNTWKQVESRTHPGGWNLIQHKRDFEAIANGTYSGDTNRVLGIPQVGRTLQANRDPGNPPISSVPDLETMSRAALNLLNNPNGFFLLIEGGASDGANHHQRLDRMVEEQIDFNQSIEVVINWVNTNSNWDETLLIVTADHECGLLWGPNSDTIAFDPVVNHGAGVLPGAAYNFNRHTNSLVPLFALGYGADRFVHMVNGIDPVRGPYIDNTDIFTVMNGALCSYVIAGDLNGDCRVDLSDLSILV